MKLTKLCAMFTSVVAAIMMYTIHSASAENLSIEEVFAPVTEIQDECQLIEGDYTDRMAASYMYTREDTGWITRVHSIRKAAHSFRCGKNPATVYLYEYADEAAAAQVADDAKQYIWGGKKPSSHHHEAIFTVRNVLVIVSSFYPKILADCLDPRVRIKSGDQK